LLIMAATLLLAGLGPCVAAQQMPTQTPQTQPSQTQPPQTPPEQPAQAPGQRYPEQQTQPTQPAPGAQVPQSQGVQTFTGMIVKSGDKYVFQDESTGKKYDIDHQDVVAQHVGRRVQVNGTLDPSGNMIHIQPANR